MTTHHDPADAVRFIGMVSHRPASEIHPPPPGAPAMDPAYVARFARAHEEAGFDRVLIAWSSSQPDATLVAAHAAAATSRIGLMVAHRPGFLAPTVAARAFATLDHLSGGRAAVHVISGGSPADQQADGDFLAHDVRYARTDEYVGLLRRVWTEAAPFDHDGPHYRVERAFAEIKPVQTPHIPIYFGGSSDAAVATAARHADVYAFWGETLEQARDTIARVRAATAAAGRDPAAMRFSISFRPVLAGTEAAAWDRARAILARVLELRGGRPAAGNARVESVGSQRLLDAAAGGPVRDRRLWTEVAAAIGAGHNSTALVGTAEQVADTLADYHAIGITTFLIRGFDPLDDAVEYGRTLIPATRAALAARAAAPAPGPAPASPPSSGRGRTFAHTGDVAGGQPPHPARLSAEAPAMPDPEVVVIIPSQGSDLNAFDDSATTLSKKVYGGKALIVRTTVAQTASDYTVEFKTRDGAAFSFAGKSGIRRVLTISHAFSGDGPNLAYHAGGYQPWGTVDGLGTELTPGAKAFWTEVGKAMKSDGQVILLGCFMGAGEYGKLVARAADKPAYASTSLFAAGNADSAVKYVPAIEAGKAPSPMKKFDPVVATPAPAPAPSP